MTAEEYIRALPALGGAGAMLLIARFVWGMSVDELDRLRTRLLRVEAERDHFAQAAQRYRRALVDAGIELPAIEATVEIVDAPTTTKHRRKSDARE